MNSLQYNWKYRRYKGNGKISDCFNDVVPDKARIHISKDMYYPYVKHNTPFIGTKLMSYTESPGLTMFLNRLIPAGGKGFNIWSDLKRAIVDGWRSDKIHVIGSSSGYDSRILAKALQELREERGDSWFGETYFVELSGEGRNFEKIMKRLGFDNYIIIEPNYDFEYFKDIHKRFNGLCAYPMNQWYDEYVRRWDEEKIQYISGYGGNVSDAMRLTSSYLVKPEKKKRMKLHDRLRYYFMHQYYYQISAFKEPKYSFHPFYSWRYINSVAGFEHKGERTAEYLSKHFVPECTNIKRMRILGEVTRNGHRTVKSKELKKMYEWFKSTRYGKISNIKPLATIEYNRWWLEYCIASYVEANNISVR